MHCYKLLYLCIVFLFLQRNCAQEMLITVEAVVGHSAELPCNVSADKKDDKLTILAWYRNSSSNAFYSSRDLREGADIGGSTKKGRYRLITSNFDDFDKLQIVTVRPSDAGHYHCLADFQSSPAHKTYVQLVVIEPPRHLWVVQENGTQVAKTNAGVNISQNIGPYYVGETVHLFCVAFEGNPQVSLSWRTDKRLLKDTSMRLSEQRVCNEILYGPLRREDHGLVLTCHASNNEKTEPLSIDIVIDMNLPPELVSLRARSPVSSGGVQGRVRAGEPLQLQCRVLGARPLPDIIWKLDESQLENVDQNVTKELSQRLVVSDIQLTISKEHDESRVSCCAPAFLQENDSYICSEGLPLSVLYPPALKIIVEEDVQNNTVNVAKGTNISLACSFQANPTIFQLVWFHEEDIIMENHERYNNKVRPILELKNVQESDAGEYACAASNDEGSTYSDPLVINITYPAYCEDETPIEFGLSEHQAINITCNVKAYPEPTLYRWLILNDTVNARAPRYHNQSTISTDGPTLTFERPNNTEYNTLFCWGFNNVSAESALHTPCTFIVTDETVPRPPTNCEATKTISQDIVVTCEKGYNGGLPQKFKFIVQETDSDQQLVSIENVEPTFMIPEPKQEKYNFFIIAFNDKGQSSTVEFKQNDIKNVTEVGADVAVSAVSNITVLSLALCGGVALVALVACGLVLCAHERGSVVDLPRAHSDPPLCAYNTEESNCETYHNSEDESEFNVRRTESFRRAMAKYPSKNYGVQRTSSFHSARYMNEMDHDIAGKYSDVIRHNPNCRVHSLQNINKKRDMDALCDHLVLHLPPETNYSVPRPMNTFYTMPRRVRQKLAKELSDETSEITQTSDGFSLPPPPDEFGTYRAATRIRDIPSKSSPPYTAITRKNSTGRDPMKNHYTNTMAPMNTVGLPTVSGAHNSLYTYPDDDLHGHQINTNPFGEDSS